jgi:hypothetical protein
MVSPLHEAVLRLLREEPRLIRRLVAGRIDSDLERDSRIEVADATVSPASTPITRAVDLALLVRSQLGEAQMTLLFEVQLARDPEKAFSWPVYIAHYAAAHRAPCVLVVITLNRSVARWVRRIARAAGGITIRPIVIGPDEIPRIDDVELARGEPALALLSVFAHFGRPTAEALPVARAFFAAIGSLDPPRGARYADMAIPAMMLKAPELGELIMSRRDHYEFQTPFMKAAYAQGKTELFIDILQRRFGPLSDDLRGRVAQASPEQLELWVDRILVAESLAAVFRDAESAERSG